MRNKNAKVSDPNKFITEPGSDEHILYAAKILPNGQIMLIESGKESISEKINSQKQMADITYIANRIAVGDTSVLRDGAVFGDFTQVPKSLAESLQLIIDGEKKFNQLPLDVRNEFDNNYYFWMMQAGSENWFNKMGLNKPVEDVLVEKGNIENES